VIVNFIRVRVLKLLLPIGELLDSFYSDVGARQQQLEKCFFSPNTAMNEKKCSSALANYVCMGVRSFFKQSSLSREARESENNFFVI
jgi:hypothetical protein